VDDYRVGGNEDNNKDMYSICEQQQRCENVKVNR